MKVVCDIEATGTGHESVFAVAFMVGDIKRVFYMPDNVEQRNENTLSWWTEDLNRKLFFYEAMYKASKNSRWEVAREIRQFIDEMYELAEGQLEFYSDSPVFDYGLVNAILASNWMLPLNRKNASTPPMPEINYLTALRGAYGSYTCPSKDAFAHFKIVRPERSESHDPFHDVEAIMKEVLLVEEAIKRK